MICLLSWSLHVCTHWACLSAFRGKYRCRMCFTYYHLHHHHHHHHFFLLFQFLSTSYCTYCFLSVSDTVDLNRLQTKQRRPKKESSGSGRRLKYGSLAKQDSGSEDSSQTEMVIGSKDTTCFLFHALGKILYFKSEFGEDGIWSISNI